MLQVCFDYNINHQYVKVTASCNEIIDSDDVQGLKFIFTNENDIRIHVEFNEETFEDIEAEALYLLAEQYYNPKLNFNQAH